MALSISRLPFQAPNPFATLLFRQPQPGAAANLSTLIFFCQATSHITMPRTLLIVCMVALVTGASTQQLIAASTCEDNITATATVAPKLDDRFYHKTETSYR